MPNPAFFAAALHKKTMGQKVLDVAVSVDALASTATAGQLHVYAHCSATHGSAGAAGSVTLMVINTHPTSAAINIPTTTLCGSSVSRDLDSSSIVNMAPVAPAPRASRTEFQLTSATGNGAANLVSRVVALNGTPLHADPASGTLPEMRGIKAECDGPIEAPPFSVTFVVFAESLLPACRD